MTFQNIFTGSDSDRKTFPAFFLCFDFIMLGKDQVSLVELRGDVDIIPRVGIFQNVGGKIVKNAVEMREVYVENIGNIDIIETADFKAFVLQKIRHFREQLGNQFISVHPFVMKWDVFIGSNGMFKEIVCQTFNQIGVLPSVFDILRLFSLILKFFILQHIQITDHRGQRCVDVMGYCGNDIVILLFDLCFPFQTFPHGLAHIIDADGERGKLVVSDHGNAVFQTAAFNDFDALFDPADIPDFFLHQNDEKKQKQQESKAIATGFKQGSVMQPSEISRNHQNGRLIRKGDRIRKRRSVQPLFGNFIDKKRLSGKKAVIDHRVFIVNADESVPILPVPFIQLFPIVGRKIVFGDKMLKVLCR